MSYFEQFMQANHYCPTWQLNLPFKPKNKSCHCDLYGLTFCTLRKLWLGNLGMLYILRNGAVE